MPHEIRTETDLVEIDALHRPPADSEGSAPSDKIARVWKRGLIKCSDGSIRPLLANAITAIKGSPDWANVLRFNAFAVRIETGRETPWGKKVEEQWTDNDDRRTAEWLQRNGIFVATNLAGEAVYTVALENQVHPVRDYLKGLKWDGTRRLGQWGHRYLTAQKSIEMVFCNKWMISAVARVYKPGCKADCALILEGPQGTQKSTALRVLAEPIDGCDWFTDQIAEFGSKDASMQCHGVWIIEMAELDSLSRAENSQIKAFISRTFDRFRLPYGKHVVNWPRDCIMAGSVNHDAYLRDETGARRFWPVKCGHIDIPALTADRDQLWAEAVHEFESRATWWLDDQKLIDEAEIEQKKRYQTGAWDGIIEEWLLSSDRDSVSIEEILTDCTKKEKSHWTRGDHMAVGAALRSQGWERYRHREGTLKWLYRKDQK